MLAKLFCLTTAQTHWQTQHGLQDGVVRIDGEAIDAEAMAACRGFGILEHWEEAVSSQKPEPRQRRRCAWSISRAFERELRFV